MNISKIIDLIKENKYFLLLLLFGLLIFCFPMLKSSFDLMPGDGIDCKFINYILEHSWLWLNHTPTHEHFWTAPFFYPNQNTLAYSDILAGIMPIYWVIRVFFSPFSALQVLYIVMCFLNYLSFYLRLKKSFNYSKPASSVGAFVFAFCVYRFFKTVHLQFFAQFFEMFALFCLFKVSKNNSSLKNHVYFILSTVLLSLQFYTCYALGYLFCFLGVILVGILLCFDETKGKIISFLKDFYKQIIIYFILLVLSLIPLAMHYLAIGEVRGFEQVSSFLINPMLWFKNISVLDSFVLKLFPPTVFFGNFIKLRYITPAESSVSIGIISTIVALFGIYKLKNFKIPLFIFCAIVFLCSCKIGDFSLWKIFYNVVPGANGMRSISRIAFISLIVFSIGVASFFDIYLKEGKKKLCKIALILLLLEAIPLYSDYATTWFTFGWSKSVFQKQIEGFNNFIPNNVKIIYFKQIIPAARYNQIEYYNICMFKASLSLLSMWSGLSKNIYIMNGYSGISKKDIQPEKYGAYVMYYNIEKPTKVDFRKHLMGI